MRKRIVSCIDSVQDKNAWYGNLENDGKRNRHFLMELWKYIIMALTLFLSDVAFLSNPHFLKIDQIFSGSIFLINSSI